MPLFSFELCTKIAPSTLYSWPLHTANIYIVVDFGTQGKTVRVVVKAFRYKIPILFDDQKEVSGKCVHTV